MSIQLSLFPDEPKENYTRIYKYAALSDNYFGFELFEEIFKVINERQHPEPCEFNSGVASAEGAVRRLREEYYESIKRLYEQEESAE
jgi:hypothetical protein